MFIKKLIKRGLSLLLVMMMCAGLLSLNVFAAESNPYYDCGLDEHQHTDACYDTQSTDTLICGQEETEGHTHDDSCYETQIIETEEQVLACGLDESEDHTHTEDCYAVQTVETEEVVLVCQLEETQGHTHSEDCYAVERVLTCELEEHAHSIECCAAYHELDAGMEKLGEELSDLQDAFFTNLTEEDMDEYGNPSEDAMNAFMAQAASQLGEEFNTLIDLYHQIPEQFSDDPDYQALAATLANIAGMLGGDLNAGVQTLATTGDKSNQNVTISASETWNGNYTQASGTYTLTVNGTMNGTVKVTGGTLTIKGNGTINGSSLNSSVITINGGNVTLDGPTITGGKGSYVSNWPESAEYGHTVGGGVCVTGGTFTMEDGAIEHNQAGAGGGIYVGQGCTLTIHGGSISYNDATFYLSTRGTDAGGGGIWIYGTAEIAPIQGNVVIQGNTSATTSDLGGGGIYVNSTASLKLTNAVITENTADGLGGGIAACVHGKVSLLNVDGAIVYSNTANQTKNVVNPTTTATVTANGYHSVGAYVDGYNYWQDNSAFKNAAQDIFSAGSKDIGDNADGKSGAIVSNVRFDNQTHNWTGWATDTQGNNFRQVNAVSDGFVYGGFLLALTAQNQNAPSCSGNKVLISGNKSATHGGGIGCNGTLTLGTGALTTSKDITGDLTINVQKTLNGADISKNSFTFELLDKDGKTVDTKTNDSTGNVTLSYAAGIDQDSLEAGDYIFYVREALTGRNENVSYDATVYKVTVTVTADGSTTEHIGNSDTIGATIYHFKVSTVTYQAGTGVGSDWTPNTNPNANSLSFTNTWKTGSLTVKKTVEKSVDDSEKNTEFTFQVSLKDVQGNPLNGQYGDVTITSGVGTFTLKHDASKTLTGIPAGSTYTVTETQKDTVLYTTTGEVTDGETIAAGDNTVNVTNTRRYVNLSVNKAVETLDNSQNPNSDDLFQITVQVGNSTEPADTIPAEKPATYDKDGLYTFVVKAGETATLTGIPAMTTYKVYGEENMPSGYKQTKVEAKQGALCADHTTIKVTNSYFKTVEDTTYTVTKDWDETPSYYMPKSITVQLLQNGNVYGQPVLLTADKEWTYTWENLPSYSDPDTKFVYSVKELSVAYAEDSDYKADDRNDGGIIRVRSTVNKDADGHYEIVGGWRVSDQNNTTLKNEWLSAEDAVKASITIHKVDSDNNELALSGVWFKLSSENGYNQTGFTVNGNVTFDGLTAGTYTLTETSPYTGYLANNMSWTITVAKGNTLQTVVEKDGTNNIVGNNTWGWDADSAVSDSNWKPSDNGLSGTLTIENTISKGSINITKALDLDGVTKGINGELADREFTFKVYAEQVFGVEQGTEMGTLTVSVNHTDTITNLRYGTYLIVEEDDTELADYTYTGLTVQGGTPFTFQGQNAWRVMVNEDGKTYAVTATNHYERDTGSLSVTKTVQGDLGNRNKEWNFTVALTSPEDYVNLLDEYTYAVTDSNGNPVLEEDGAEKGGTLTFVESENGSIEATFTLKHGETATIAGIPVGTTYKVTETEANKDGYSTSVDDAEDVIVKEGVEAKFYNARYSTPTTSLTVNKVWDDEGHEDARPGSIQVQLYRNGAAYGTPVTLDESNGWNHRWTGLSTMSDWTAEEINVPDGYTVSAEQSGTVVTITNTYEENEDEDEEDEEELDDPDVPLSDLPDDPDDLDDSDEPEEDFDEPDVPLSDMPDEPDEELDDPDVPLAEMPDEPDEELDDPDIPLAEMPDEPDEELDDPDVPLTEMPDEPEVELEDSDVPLADVPQTGDRSGLWYALTAASAAGLLALTAAERKKREENN